MYHDQALIPIKTIDFYGGVEHHAGIASSCGPRRIMELPLQSPAEVLRAPKA